VLNHATTHSRSRYPQAENQPHKQHIYFFPPQKSQRSKKIKELFFAKASNIIFKYLLK